jgi:hypothetical protein
MELTMRGTLIFVHGTGVRQAGLEKTWDIFQSRARKSGFDGVTLDLCDWGPTHAPHLDRIDAALPETAAPDLVEPTSDSAAAWELLLGDPLFELRLAAEAAPRAAPVAVPGQARPDAAALGLIANLAELEEGDVTGSLSAAGISGDEVRGAALLVAGSDEFGQAALVAGSELDEDFLESVARAVVAYVLVEHRDDEMGAQPELAFRPQLRSDVVDLVVRTLYPGITRGVGTWLRDKMLRFVMNPVTGAAAARRRNLMGLSTAALADILYYQRRGGDIRDYVAHSLLDRERPLTVVGHSLGGVVLVDLLSSGSAPAVDLLVTVGSQSPLFYAIDALEHLRPGVLPAPFTPWLNVYNEADLLSFCAERVFPDTAGIRDVAVDAGVPFPWSHSAYWEVDAVFDAIKADWPSLGEP